MIFRIDQKTFLTHAIDYFSYEDLTNMQFIILSAKISNGGRYNKIIKDNELYPDIDTIEQFATTGDRKTLKKMYFTMIDKDVNNPYACTNHYHIILYKDIIDPLMKHYNVTLICHEDENAYVDCLCDYLKEKFKIEVIDLNALFKTGHCGPIYIDRNEIHDKAVSIRLSAAKQDFESKKQTSGGRSWLIAHMSKKEKLRELEKLEIKVSDNDKDCIDELLQSSWEEMYNMGL